MIDGGKLDLIFNKSLILFPSEIFYQVLSRHLQTFIPG